MSDPVTEKSRGIVHDQLRRRLTSKQPRTTQYGPVARTKEEQWHSLNGHEKLLFLEAVSQQLNAWQENAAATVIPPAEAKVIRRTLRKQGLQDRVMQSRFVLVDKNEGKNTAENPLDTKAFARVVVPGHADPDVLDTRRDSPIACQEAINVLLAISARKGREKRSLLTPDVQAAFLKGEFQDKDRVLYCWPAAHLEWSLWIK